MNTSNNGIGFDFCAFLDYDKSPDVALYEIGSYQCIPGYSYGPVIRPRGILHYATSGKGRLIINDREYHIHKEQIFYIPAGISAYYQADYDDPWAYSWTHFGGTAMLEVLNDCDINENNPVRDVPIPKGDTISPLTRILNDIFKSYEREYYTIGKTYEIMDFLCTSYMKRTSATTESLQLQYVKTVIKFIHLKFSEPILVDDIANACGLNRSYLSRLFHDATGSTIKDYLISYRIGMAENMLKNTDNTIQYIAFAVGYSDIFTFSKAFKKITGLSPSDFMKSNT